MCVCHCLSTWSPHVTITNDVLGLIVHAPGPPWTSDLVPPLPWTWPHPLGSPDPPISDLGPPLPAGDIWWPSLETCSLEDNPQQHLVAAPLWWKDKPIRANFLILIRWDHEQESRTYSNSIVGFVWLSLPICLPNCFTFSLANRLKIKSEIFRENTNLLSLYDYSNSNFNYQPIFSYLWYLLLTSMELISIPS